MGAIGAVGVAAIGLVDLFGAPTGAQSTGVVAELVSVDSADAPVSGANTRPSVSDDGTTIVFTNRVPAAGGAPAAHDLIIRRRANDPASSVSLRIVVASPSPISAAVSGDGCVVAYSAVVPRPSDPPADNPPADVPPLDGAEAVAAAPLVAARQAVTDVIELRTLDLCVAPGIDPAPAVLDRIDAAVGATVQPLSAPALSSDGKTVAFATPDSVAVYDAASTPEQPSVVSIPAPGAGQRIGARLDVTGDGSTVVFESGPLTPNPADAAAAIDASVHLATITPAAVATDPPVVAVELFAPSAAGSSWPSISADGMLVVYQSDQQLPIDGIPAEGPYAVVAQRGPGATTHRLLADAAVRPDLSSDGASVAYDLFGSVQVRRSESAVPFAEFTERIANARVGVDFVEGTGASVSGAALSGDGTTVVFDQPANAALTSPALPGAHVWAQSTEQLFAPPSTTTTTSSTTTTTTTTTTTVAVTQPPVTAAPTTTPRTTTRSTTTRTTTRSTVGSTVRPTSQQVAFVPSTFEFAPTIVNAGRRTATIALNNPTSSSVSVASIVADTAGVDDFTIDPAACTTLAPGATCSVAVDFAPGATGERTTTVVATLSDGSTVSAVVRGIGAPEPTLSVVPGVASNGQVVAVIGAGFPAALTIEFSANDGASWSEIEVGERGGFTETMVVMPNTASGPLRLVVAAEVDLFGEVATSLLVSDSSSRGNTAVLAGGVTGASLGR